MRRNRVEIWMDILRAVQATDEGTPPSRVLTRANVPHDRFWRYVDELDARGLIEREPLRTTSAGESFLAESAHVRMMLRNERPDP